MHFVGGSVRASTAISALISRARSVVRFKLFLPINPIGALGRRTIPLGGRRGLTATVLLAQPRPSDGCGQGVTGTLRLFPDLQDPDHVVAELQLPVGSRRGEVDDAVDESGEARKDVGVVPLPILDLALRIPHNDLVEDAVGV